MKKRFEQWGFKQQNVKSESKSIAAFRSKSLRKKQGAFISIRAKLRSRNS